MLPVNWIAVLVSGLVPLIVGSIWYNPKVFGTAWMAASGMTEEKAEGSNMLLIFGLSFLFSLFIAVFLIPVVIHQAHIYSTLVNEPGFKDASSKIGLYIASFMKQYGSNFRTPQHGALHGTIAGILFATPIVAINSMFERKGAKYILIHAGYWTVCFAIMGALICGWK